MKKNCYKKEHIIECLSLYELNLNPIGNKWAHAKKLKQKQQCTIDELFEIL